MIGSTNALEGWRVVGRDGELSTLKAFYFDDQRWAIRLSHVHTGGWFRGRDVLLSTRSSAGRLTTGTAPSTSRSRAPRSSAHLLILDMLKPVSRQLEAQYGR